jgi:UDP-4-amino-4,6-dideoxy-N-acetyl-beta-L-altrosamine N-acetyltransferase
MSSPKPITLRLLTLLDRPAQMTVRTIRNEENVRKWMYTDHVISEEEHLNWIERLKTDSRQIVFAVLDEQGSVLGLVSVNGIDQRHKKTDWAYYLTESARGGLGSALEFGFINFIFNTLGMEKLNCEVIEGNDPVVRMHKKFFFQEEGFRRADVLKDGLRIGAHFLGLTKADWQAGTPELLEKYGAVFDKFALSIDWPGHVG